MRMNQKLNDVHVKLAHIQNEIRSIMQPEQSFD